jgi:NADPH-dependent glutamate synthase beta subunit-like oxidoreductase
MQGTPCTDVQEAIRAQLETSAQRLCLGCGKPYPCASDCPAGTASPTTSVTK